MPADLELATCDKGVYRQFLGPGESLDLEPSELTSALAPSTSQPDVLYVLDLAGSPWVLWTWHDADSSAQDMAELDVMLGSIRIASPAPAAPSPLN